MSVAALWDELVGEEGDPLGDALPGPLLGGSPAGGVPFLTDPLGADARIMVEAAFGADVTSTEAQTWNWFDITADVRQADGNKVTISPVGRSDETSQAQPAGCGFQLDNTTGTYTANHPASPWFPYVRRNTPIRVRLYVNGSWSTRFQGYANGWVPSWDTTGNLAVVTVSASGVLRQLNQGKTPLRSALYRAIIRSSPVAYWALEDASGATQAAGQPGGLPLVADGIGPKFGAVSMTGSAPVADFSNGGRLGGGSPPIPTSSWRVEFTALFKASSTSIISTTSQMQVIGWYTQGSYYQWRINVINLGAADIVELAAYNRDGTAAFELISNFHPFDGLTHNYRIDVSQNGANFNMNLSIDGVSSTSYGGLTGTIAAITGVVIAPQDPSTDYSSSKPGIGHVAIWAPYSSNVDTAYAATGYAGETATARLARLCGEQNLPIAVVGTCDTAMGAQTVDTFVNLVRECEATDDGLLYDGLGSGLGYVTRQSRYNAPAALSPDMAADPPQVGDPYTPVDDDQRNRNLIKVDRKNGSSATVEDQAGVLGTAAIGVYDSSVTVNAKDDSGLAYRAGWEVRKGTVQGFRHPTLSLDLAAAPAPAPGWLAVNLAGRIDVLNISSKATQHPPGTVSLMLEGYAESLSPFDWQVTANCSPYAPWRVAVIEGTGDTAWRIDSGGSTVAADVLAGATSLSVAVTDGYLWSTSAGDYPRDMDVGGAQVTVTAVSGASSPQTFTITAVTYPLKTGWSVSLWRPPMIAL